MNNRAVVILAPLVGLLALVLFAGAAAAQARHRAGPVKPGAATPLNVEIEPTFLRTVHARIFDEGTWTAGAETPEAIAREIASLRPTLVSGLLRLTGDDPAEPEVKAWDTVRRIIRERHPDCRFDVVLDARQFPTDKAIVASMTAINTRLHPDQWFFEFFNAAGRAHPAAVAAAIHYAHAHNQPIGGDVSGSVVPDGTDYAAVSDANGFEKMAGEARKLRRKYRIPVLAHLHGDAEKPDRDGNEDWVQAKSPEQREQYLAELAEGQPENGYRLMWPVLFPEFPARHAYVAYRDGGMWQAMTGLLDKYSAAPGR
jgi:hypothetical protein